MRLRQPILSLEGDPASPVSTRVEGTLLEAIRSGRLRPGQALPGTRALSEMLGVNRKTVIAVLETLEIQGWLRTEPNRGTFVEQAAPTPPGPSGKGPEALAFDLPSRLSPLSSVDEARMVLSDGQPDARLFPAQALARAYQRALQRHGDRLLQQGEPMGNALLREAMVAWLGLRRGMAVSPAQVLVTRGTRSSLILLALGLLKDGDGVAVEEPGSRGVWEVLLQARKARLHPVPVDAGGLCVSALAELLDREKIRFLLVTPQRHYPTTASMGEARRKALLELASAHRLAIVEDDYDTEFVYEGAPTLPLAHEDRAGQVVYLSSFSRSVAPGLRLGIMVGPEALMARLARLQQSLDWQGDRALEWAMGDLMRDGDLERRLHRARRIYRGRRDQAHEALRARFRGRLFTELPAGGLAFWVGAEAGVDLEGWLIRARAHGLALHLPSDFYAGPAQARTRLGFGQCDEGQFLLALDRLEAAWGG